MTDHERTGLPAVQGAGDLLGYPDRDAVEQQEEQELPAHEHREERAVGGDVLATGGTATDRGAGAGQEGDGGGDVVDEPDELNPTTHLPG